MASKEENKLNQIKRDRESSYRIIVEYYYCYQINTNIRKTSKQKKKLKSERNTHKQTKITEGHCNDDDDFLFQLKIQWIQMKKHGNQMKKIRKIFNTHHQPSNQKTSMKNVLQSILFCEEIYLPDEFV